MRAELEPNSRLASLLAQAGLSRKAFARAVQMRAATAGDLISVDHTSVSRWLRGSSPRASTASHIIAVLTERLGHTISMLDAGFGTDVTVIPTLGLDYPDDAGRALDVTEHLLDADLADARALTTASTNDAAWSQAGLAWIVRCGQDRLPTTAAGRRIGVSDVLALRRSTTLFAELDDQFGGNYGRRAVAQHLRSAVLPLLRGTYTEPTGRALFAAAAEALHLLAWMSYDAGAHGLAQRYFLGALRLAEAGEEVLFAASTLDAMSHQATYLGRYRAAAALARAARHGSARLATATLTAHFYAMEARALAGAGDRVGTEAALARAQHLFEDRKPEEDPAFIAYFDEGELSAEIGHCYRDLDGGTRAADAARLALTGSPRSDFFVTMVQAHALLQADDLDQAAAVVRSALDAGRSLQSARCVQYVRRFRTDLDRRAASAALAQDLASYAADNPLWIAGGTTA
jgi:transcriptional regulator with XRE-family HTH domain